MSRKIIKSRNIFLICFLIPILFISVIIVKLTNQHKNTDMSNKNKIYDYYIDFENLELNSKLQKYLSSGYETSINNINGNNIYGDIHDTTVGNDLFVTKYIYSYNVETKKFEIYKFNKNFRILNYFLIDDYIYASIIYQDNKKTSEYQWSIVKYNKDFSDYQILINGIVLDPISAPNFYYDNNEKKLYTVALNEDYIEDNSIIISRKQQLTTYLISNGTVLKINEKSGDYINKTGEMICGAFNVQINNSELLYCLTDYANKQIIVSYNLLEKKEEVLYENNIGDNLLINNFQKKDNYLYVGLMYMNNMQSGKTIYYDLTSKNIVTTDSETFYGKYIFVKDKLLFHNLEKWKLYDSKNNKFFSVNVIGKHKDEYLYPTIYIINYNKIIVKTNNNIYYIGELKKI